MTALLDAFTVHLGTVRTCIDEITDGISNLDILDNPSVDDVDKASALAEALVVAWADFNDSTVEEVLGFIDDRQERAR